MIEILDDIKITSSMFYFIGVIVVTYGWWYVLNKATKELKNEIYDLMKVNDNLKNRNQELRDLERAQNSKKFKNKISS